MESIFLPRKEFDRELSTAVHDRGQAAFYAHQLLSPSLPCTSAYMRVQDLKSICSVAHKGRKQLKFGDNYAMAPSQKWRPMLLVRT